GKYSAHLPGGFDERAPACACQPIQSAAFVRPKCGSPRPVRQWVRLRSSGQTRRIRSDGNEGACRGNGRKNHDSERDWERHGDFDRPARRHRFNRFCKMSTAAKRQPAKAQTDRIRVLVADDHVTVREGLVAIIGRQQDMKVVSQASNGREALELWQKFRHDVAVLDRQMPGLDGVRALEEIRLRDESVRALVLTTFDTDADVSRAIKAGAKGYLLKDAPREELLASIRKVYSGETSIPP